MIWGHNWLYITFIALLIDILIGNFPIKHPVQYMGDFIRWFESFAYKNSIMRGSLLTVSLVLIVAIITVLIQYGIFYAEEKFKLPEIIGVLVLGVLSSVGLASTCLKDFVKKVIFEDDYTKKRENLSYLVTRKTESLDDKKVYSSLIETHSENLGDGFISPLIYLILFGLPGVMVFKAISTLDSVVGYKNEKYEKFGKCSAIVDDIVNYIPARLTGVLIWLFGKRKISPVKIIKEAKHYSSSPNAGYPVTAAAYATGVKVGGTIYYGDQKVYKGEIGDDISIDYKLSALEFINIHKNIDIFIITIFIFSIILMKNIPSIQ